jgi:NAD(P)H-nitrite reductase large subunit
VVLGDLTAAQFRALSRIAQEHGEGEVRFSNDQDVVLRYVPTWKLPVVHADLADAGLAKSGAGTVRDVTSCPGASSCAMSVTQSRGLARLLTDTLEARPDLVATAKDLTIKISGCPNSCGQHHVAGLGFQGGMRKVDGKAVAQYLVHVGGGIGPDGAVFGRFVTKIPVRRLPEAVERLIGLYGREKAEGERADAFFRRVSLDKVKDVPRSRTCSVSSTSSRPRRRPTPTTSISTSTRRTCRSASCARRPKRTCADTIRACGSGSWSSSWPGRGLRAPTRRAAARATRCRRCSTARSAARRCRR